MHLKASLLLSRGFLIVGFLLLMSWTNDVKPPNYDEQRAFFLNAIEQVQKSGDLLQKKSLDNDSIEKAMVLLDSSMLNANSVDAAFLKWVDAGLYQAFSGYLVKGVENYRLGFVYENKQQQAEGIEQLQRWWQFWQLKRPAILQKLDASI